MKTQRLVLLGALLGVLISVQLGVTFYTAKHARDLVIAQREETHARIDQTCRLFESSHLTDVQQLGKTYTYLLAVKRHGELGATINQFVLAALPEQERQAHIDAAPAYCDEPGLGLPEPDPVIPRRPSALGKTK